LLLLLCLSAQSLAARSVGDLLEAIQWFSTPET
jgi:hypothetical protein